LAGGLESLGVSKWIAALVERVHDRRRAETNRLIFINEANVPECSTMQAHLNLLTLCTMERRLMTRGDGVSISSIPNNVYYLSCTRGLLPSTTGSLEIIFNTIGLLNPFPLPSCHKSLGGAEFLNYQTTRERQMSDSPILNQVLVMVPAKKAIEGVIELRSLRTDRAIRRRAARRLLFSHHVLF